VQTNQFKGVMVMLVTVLIWGGMFPVAKGALQTLMRSGCPACATASPRRCSSPFLLA
jgi:hypothetical protein